MSRKLVPLPIPTGPALLDLLPRLAAALHGEGDALLPVAASETREARELTRALAAGTPLADHEDDPLDPTAVVIATSGSTGNAKGALLSAAALAASAAATRLFLESRPGSAVGSAHWLLALPAHHIAGLQVLLRSIADGTAPTVLDIGLPFTASAFCAAVDRMPAGRSVTSLVPTQLHRVLQDEEATAALAGFDAVLVGGAATPDSLQDHARSRGIKLVTTYGMSETCGGCVYDGQPLPGVALDIAESGQLSVGGPMVARGYRGQPGHAAFSSHTGEFPEPVHPLRGRWSSRVFRTSDLAVRTGDGRLRILGRMDDVIITGGIKIDPAVLESELIKVPGVEAVAITSVTDPEWGRRLVALVVAGHHRSESNPTGADPDGPGPDLAEFSRRAVAAHGPAAAPKNVLLVDAIPLRGIGKPDRAAIAALAERRLREDVVPPG